MRPTRASRPSGLAQGGCVLVALAVAVVAAPAPGAGAPPPGQDALLNLGEASAEIRFPTPVGYAVVRQEPEKIRRLYARGEIIFHPSDSTRSWTVERVEPRAVILRAGPRGHPQTLQSGHPIPGFPGLTFTGTVLLDQIHYRYKLVDQIQHPDPVLVALEGSRAILEVEVLRSPAPVAGTPSERVAPLAPDLSPPGRATLDAEVLGKVRVRELAPGLYDVNAVDAKAALQDAGRVVAEVWPAVQPTLSLQTGLQYRITSAASDGVLTAQGYTVTAPKLAERFGIQAGDTILSVNGQSVDGFASLYGIFRALQRDPSLRNVQVELDRGGARLIKTYLIR